MQGTISFDGTLSGGISGGGGGGSDVTITPTLQSGTKIADYSIDDTPGSLYAPTPEDLPGTLVTKVLRKYNDTTQTKIATVTTLDTSNNQEVSQDIYAPSPVQCCYTPGLEQDYRIGQFTYGDVTQNVYIPDFQRPLTAGTGISIDQDNVISCTASGGGINYSTSEQDTGLLWKDGTSHVYQKTIEWSGSLARNQSATLDSTIKYSDLLYFTVIEKDFECSSTPSGTLFSNYYTNTVGGGNIEIAINDAVGIYMENYSNFYIRNVVLTIRYVKSV